MDNFLTKKGIEKRKLTSDVMAKAEPELVPYIKKAEFPLFMVSLLLFQKDRRAATETCGYQIKDHGGPGLSLMDSCASIYEIAKYDGSVATFCLVHNSIGIAPIDMLGNEEQRARLLPGCIKMEKICCFGLTEPDFGSDATGLQTTAKKVDGGYIINGHKRWIGNADICAYCIVWAKNVDEDNKIQGFVVENGTPGYIPRKIENKMSFLMVQNQDILLKDVFVPDNNRLEKAKDFNSGTNVIL